MIKKPLLDTVPSSKVPIEQTKKTFKEVFFSFKYWQAIKNYELGDTDSKWVLSFISILKDLSLKDRDSLVNDSNLRNQLRYHRINWNAKGCKNKRVDFSWIDNDILENEEEFPFYQFRISKALGRVVGFWIYNTFYIVLIDRKHNLQPSQYSNWKIKSTGSTGTNYDELLAQIDRIKSDVYPCNRVSCRYKPELDKIPHNKYEENILLHFISDEELCEIHKILDCGKANSIKDILLEGVLSILSD